MDANQWRPLVDSYWEANSIYPIQLHSTYVGTCVGRSGLERERAIVLSINRTADLSLIWIGGRGERRSFIWVTKIFDYDWLKYLNPALYVCILLIIVYVSHNIGRTFNGILYEYCMCWMIIDVHITHNTLWYIFLCR